MAYQINVINAVEAFFEEISALLRENGIHSYLEKREGSSVTITNIADTGNLSAVMDDRYHSLYLATERYDPEKYNSFYDDSFCHHVIEVLGGRSTATEMENISLRIMSKTPDKKLISFFNKLGRRLKNSSDYGMGVGPGKGAFYRNVLYKKDAVKNRTLWFDFRRKVQPVIPG